MNESNKDDYQKSRECLPHGFWKDEQRVLEYVRGILEKYNLDCVPPPKIMKQLGIARVYSSIQRYYGSVNEFNHKYFGKDLMPRTKRGSLKNVDFLTERLLKVMRGHNVVKLPSERELDKWGESGLAGAIMKHHHGFTKFRVLLEGKLLRHPKHTWENESFIIKYSLEIMKEHNFSELPSWGVLISLGYANLINGAQYHGGLEALRNKLNLLSGKTEKQKLEELLNDLTGEAL